MVARSNNETRLEKMKKRNECVENLKVLAITKLQNNFDKDTPQYQQTVKNLIIQVSKQTANQLYFYMVGGCETIIFFSLERNIYLGVNRV